MSAPPLDFDEFRAFSAALGADPLLAQGAGGNTSIKHEGAMWIKASGAWLKDAGSKNIFVPVDQATLKPLADGRPSIETVLHAALPQRIVIHTHAVPVLAYAVRRDAEKVCAEKLSGLCFAFIPYAKPGEELAQALRAKTQSSPPDIFILGNHGLIVAGETMAQAKMALADVLARFEAATRPVPLADIKFLEQARGKSWRLPASEIVHSLATDKISRDYAVGGTLYPDHVVFLGRGCRAISADKLATIDPAKQPMILIEGKGVLLAASLSPAGESMAEALTAILARIPSGVALNYLSAADEDELLNWDAEKHRQAAQ